MGHIEVRLCLFVVYELLRDFRKFLYELRQVICMEKLLKEAWDGPEVGRGRVSGNQ